MIKSNNYSSDVHNRISFPTDLNEIEAISTNTSRIHLLFDTKSCFSEPITPAVSRTGYHFALGGVIVLISLTQVYFLRLRHAICDRFAESFLMF